VLVGNACGDPSDTECTNPDTCDAGAVCQPNDLAAGTSAPAQCGDGNECTADECDGSGGCQNPNLVAGSACGDPSDTQCDGADTCDGAGTCQANVASAGAAAPVFCDDGNDCTNDVCDGSGGCNNPFHLLGTACGDPSTLPCSLPDSCDGAGTCRPNDLLDGTVCDDGDVCTSDEICAGAVCVPGGVTDCSDGDPCTADSCDPLQGGCLNLFEPDPTCTEGGAGGFSIINKDGADHDQLRFKWFRGDDDVLYSDLGDPSASTEYQFCVFDTDAGVGSLVHRIDIPTGPFWRLKPEKKMVYRDKSGSAGGLITFKIKAGSKTKFKTKLKVVVP